MQLANPSAAQPAIYCASLGAEFQYLGVPIYVSPLLWSALHDIPTKVAHHQDFLSRARSVALATRLHMQRFAKNAERKIHFSVLMLIGKEPLERQILNASIVQDAFGMNVVEVKLALEN